MSLSAHSFLKVTLEIRSNFKAHIYLFIPPPLPLFLTRKLSSAASFKTEWTDYAELVLPSVDVSLWHFQIPSPPMQRPVKR